MHWDGKTYKWDPEEVDVQQGIVIKMTFGWTLVQWQEAVAAVDPQAFQALFWLMRIQNGEACELTSQNFSIKQFSEEFGRASKEAQELEDSHQGNAGAPIQDSTLGSVPISVS